MDIKACSLFIHFIILKWKFTWSGLRCDLQLSYMNPAFNTPPTVSRTNSNAWLALGREFVLVYRGRNRIADLDLVVMMFGFRLTREIWIRISRRSCLTY